MKILNLYAGIGGNRKLWNGHDITAVELNPEIAKIYQDFYPNDKVIIADAHEYLLEHYKEYDFIWSSPPCPTHSEIRRCGVYKGRYAAKYPDMKLYEEIILLKYFSKCKWIVENVKGYYTPLIIPIIIDKHYVWSNFVINPIKLKKAETHLNIKSGKTIVYGFDINKYEIKKRKDTILRNLLNPEIGKYILEQSQYTGELFG